MIGDYRLTRTFKRVGADRDNGWCHFWAALRYVRSRICPANTPAGRQKATQDVTLAIVPCALLLSPTLEFLTIYKLATIWLNIPVTEPDSPEPKARTAMATNTSITAYSTVLTPFLVCAH
jgi:hypothetical protein